jgi:hypothetical protein
VLDIGETDGGPPAGDGIDLYGAGESELEGLGVLKCGVHE